MTVKNKRRVIVNNYEIHYQDVCGIAFESKKPTKKEIVDCLILNSLDKIEMMGAEKWLREMFTKIKLIKS